MLPYVGSSFRLAQAGFFILFCGVFAREIRIVQRHHCCINFVQFRLNENLLFSALEYIWGYFHNNSIDTPTIKKDILLAGHYLF